MTTTQTDDQAGAAAGRSLFVETHWNEKRRAYAVRLVLDEDGVVRMDAAAATRHAAAVLAYAQQAEYDAAVARQLRDALELPMPAVAEVITGLRRTRRMPSKADTAPLVLSTVLSESLEGVVAIRIDGRQVGQWTTDEARKHAQFVMETTEAARLDTAYRRYLVDVIGIEDGRSSQVVHDLVNYRPGRGE